MTTYNIAVITSWYGPRIERTLLTDPLGEVAVFPSREAAQAKIADLDGAHYELRHNESARAQYVAVKAK